MTKIGRNQPCPCGSGKKYKQCCLRTSVFPIIQKRDELDLLMEKGGVLLQQGKTAEACDLWLEFWNNLKERLKPEFRDVKEAETVFSGSEFIYNWCQDLECELGNAGISDSVYYQKRIVYCDEFCSLFPESEDTLLHAMKRAISESHFALGNSDEGSKCFKNLIELYPENIWGYVGWGDMYLWPKKKISKPDLKKAEQIYKMALDKGMENEDVLLDRLKEIKNIREQKA